MTERHVVVITMVQEGDFPSAWSSIKPLGRQLNERRTRLILLNDVRNARLENQLEALPHTTVIAPGENLGVAVGRNVLFERAVEMGAEWVVAIDSDIYVPRDYLDRLCAAVGRCADDVGVIAPTVLAFQRFGDANPDLVDAELAVEGMLDDTVDTDSVVSRIDPGDRAMFYHLGVSDWRAHYLDPTSPTGRRLRDDLFSLGLLSRRPEPLPSVSDTFLASNAAARSQAGMAGPEAVEVDCVAGGVSAFRTRLLGDIGMCDERFSPFGYEDADLCIRARRHGYRVQWHPSALLLHDFRNRGRQRDGIFLALTASRARALLAGNHLDDAELMDHWFVATVCLTADAHAVAEHRACGKIRDEVSIAVVAASIAGLLIGATEQRGDAAAYLDRLSLHLKGVVSRQGDVVRWVAANRRLAGNLAPALSLVIERREDEILGWSELRYPDGFRARVDLSLLLAKPLHPSSVRFERFQLDAFDCGVTVARLKRDGQDWAARWARAEASHTTGLLEAIRQGYRRLLFAEGSQQPLVIEFEPREPVAIHAIGQSARPRELSARVGYRGSLRRFGNPPS